MTAEELQTVGALLASRKTEERLQAVRKLARIAALDVHDLDAQKLLIKALSDRVNYVASLAAEALAQCADARLLPQLVAHFAYLSEDGLKRDPGCHIRAELATLFGKREVQTADAVLRVGIRTRQVEPVAGVPTDTAMQLRANSALALAYLRPPGALRDIAPLLFDKGDPSFTAPSHTAFVTIEVRKVAAQALARLADPASIVPLVIKLTYPAEEAPEVLQECMQAVVDLEDERALELLQPYLHHRDQSLAAFACLMIARMRDPQAVALIRSTLDNLSGDPLQAALLALSTLRTEESNALLKELAQSHRKDIKRIARELVPE